MGQPATAQRVFLAIRNMGIELLRSSANAQLVFSNGNSDLVLPDKLETAAPSIAWENREKMSLPWANLQSARWKAAFIAVLILLLAVVTWFTPPRAVEAHNILHHLNFLPLMMAGMLFGWRGAAWALLFAVSVQAPTIVRHSDRWPLDAQDQIVELSYLWGCRYDRRISL